MFHVEHEPPPRVPLIPLTFRSLADLPPYKRVSTHGLERGADHIIVHPVLRATQDGSSSLAAPNSSDGLNRVPVRRSGTRSVMHGSRCTGATLAQAYTRSQGASTSLLRLTLRPPSPAHDDHVELNPQPVGSHLTIVSHRASRGPIHRGERSHVQGHWGSERLDRIRLRS